MSASRRAELEELAKSIRDEIKRLDDCTFDLISILKTSDNESLVRCAAGSIYVCDLSAAITAFTTREAKP